MTFEGNDKSRRLSCVALVSSALGFEAVGDQENVIKRFAKENGFNVELVHTIADGASVDDILKSLTEKAGSTLICSRLSLLPSSIRSLQEVIEFLAKLSDCHITFVSVQDNLDTDESAQAFLVKLNFAWANFKIARKAANARASYGKAKAKKTPFGRQKKVDDSEILALRKKGLSIREIAAKVNLSTTAVYKTINSFNNLRGVKKPLDLSL